MLCSLNPHLFVMHVTAEGPSIVPSASRSLQNRSRIESRLPLPSAKGLRVDEMGRGIATRHNRTCEGIRGVKPAMIR